MMVRGLSGSLPLEYAGHPFLEMKALIIFSSSSPKRSRNRTSSQRLRLQKNVIQRGVPSTKEGSMGLGM